MIVPFGTVDMSEVNARFFRHINELHVRRYTGYPAGKQDEKSNFHNFLTISARR